MVRIYCKLERITPKAFYVTTADDKGKKLSVWLPKSQVNKTDCLAAGDEGYMDIPQWLADKNNLKSVDPSDCDDE